MRVLANWTHAALILKPLAGKHLSQLVLLGRLIFDFVSKRDKVFQQTLDPFQALFKAINFFTFHFCDDLGYLMCELLLFLKFAYQMLKVCLFLVSTDSLE